MEERSGISEQNNKKTERLCIPTSEGKRGSITVKDYIWDEQSSVVESTERLVKIAAEEMNLAIYIDRMSKREISDPRLREWKAMTLHGMFLSETVRDEKHYRRVWLGKDELKRET